MTTKQKGVMIVGMDIPKGCFACRFCIKDGSFGYVYSALNYDQRAEVDFNENKESRPFWCPLQEVQ